MGTVRESYDRAVGDGRIEPDPAQDGALDELDRIGRALEETSSSRLGWIFRSPKPLRGLYLWGGVGRGKSMLMDMFHDNVDIRRKRRVHFHAFMQDVQKGLHRARQTGVDDAIRPVAEEIAADLRLLCFDEMQIGDIADAMIVGRLFQRLFDSGVTVVATSNRPPDDLYKDGLNRQLFLPFIALVNDHMAVRELASPRDWRQDRLSGKDRYFSPANAEARAAIDAIWGELTGGEASGPLLLEVNGRSVRVDAFRNGVARASFWELCARALGPADYLALAQAVRMLILEDVPRLSSENYNEARRFVTLIDALYEARTRLIVSAADVPDRLYIEGEGSFEFARTASRLAEMQSDGWAV